MATDIASLDALFSDTSVMAILRGMPEEETLLLAHRMWDLGITALEVPVSAPGALPVLRAAAAAGAQRGRAVGAGTVITPDQVRAVAAAGAAFTVAPGFDPEVMAASHQAGMPHLPGVATPTDIQAVLRSGGRWVKAFPASVLGPAWVTAVRAPFPDLQIVATGGLDTSSAADYLDAGAAAVALGSALADPAQLNRVAELLRR